MMDFLKKWGESLETGDLWRLPNRVQRVSEPNDLLRAINLLRYMVDSDLMLTSHRSKIAHIPYKSSVSIHKNRHLSDFKIRCLCATIS